ncbi:hypothetical protein KR222_010495, partial [Zaprionus bogoriensis]
LIYTMTVAKSLVLFCGIVMPFCALAYPRNETEIQSQSSSSSADDSDCGSTENMVDECFKDLPPHLMEFLQNTKIVISKKEILAKCNIFERGMKCFDAYSARCLQNQKVSLFKNNVEGARRFFGKFCADEDFQRDYLRHKECFAHIKPDWITCTKEFENILSEDLQDYARNTSDKYLEFCCARNAYENCIYNSARYKCYQNSVEFARETAKMLSDEKHFGSCRDLEEACSKAGSIVLVRITLLPMVILVLRRTVRIMS